jgi:ATP-dependent protease HslVU (ClpYQ) peptidase subunit
MTTIAWDGRYLAADGQRTFGDRIAGTDFRKIVVKGVFIYAFTGMTPMMDVMIAWHQEGADPEKLPLGWDKDEGGWTLVVVDGNGLGKYSDGCPYLERLPAPWAFGAGQEYAIGAMRAGADARRAIEIVSEICYHTGGTIQVVDREDTALRLVATREAAE